MRSRGVKYCPAPEPLSEVPLLNRSSYESPLMLVSV